MMGEKTLQLSNDKWLAGVCGGIANHFGWSANAVRLAYILVSLFFAAFPGLIVYIVLWLVLPKADTV